MKSSETFYVSVGL